jgi:hypothetical protein
MREAQVFLAEYPKIYGQIAISCLFSVSTYYNF